MGKIRLYTQQPIKLGSEFVIKEEQAHYLCNVMKIKEKDIIACFDGINGEFDCEIISISKKQCILKAVNHNKGIEEVPDIWLLFAPIKKDNTDFIIQKSTELGVKKIIPVLTRYTITDRVKKERYIANAIEASEQCRRTDVPEIEDSIKLDVLLKLWDSHRTLYYMDETLKGTAVNKVFSSSSEPCAILVGPEGGFSEEELKLLRTKNFAKGVKLGNRILRAETAVVSALSCWQALSGDWKE